MYLNSAVKPEYRSMFSDLRIIEANGTVSAAFTAIGIHSFSEAAQFVASLPYGRISNSGRPQLVLQEQRGTCSSKHACLALLAAESGRVEWQLTVGIYKMNELNTPGTGEVLSRYGMEYMPEAHTYLVCGGKRYDFTGLASGASSFEETLLKEYSITPEQAGSFKAGLHKGFLNEWLKNEPGITMGLEEVWRVREACINALSGKG